MKIQTLLLLPACVLLCLTSCSTQSGRPESAEGFFATHIDDDGIKKFQYTVDSPDRGLRSYEQFQQISKGLENTLEQELNKSDFCREGYRETERVVEPPMVYIRGECKETAIADDRERFPNDVD